MSRTIRLAAVALVAVATTSAACAVGPTASIIPVTGVTEQQVTVRSVLLTTGSVKVTFTSLAGVDPDFVMVEIWTDDMPNTYVLRAEDGFQGVLEGPIPAGSNINIRLQAFCDDQCGWDTSSRRFLYSVSIV